MAFYTTKELKKLGLANCGENVLISKKASLYNLERITIGNHVRIDDFCVISAGDGGIEIGDYVHIAVFCSLIGAGKIMISDFVGLSARVSVFSSNDDYSGRYLTNPMVPSEFKDVIHADVFIGKHVIVGSGTVILPGITIEEGVAIGALSLVDEHCTSFGIYVGRRRIKERKKDLLSLESRFRDKQNSQKKIGN